LKLSAKRALLEAGEAVLPETRHWDESKGMTFSMRSKEKAADYRYFPDPNLYPLKVDPSWVEPLKSNCRSCPMPGGIGLWMSMIYPFMMRMS
jgi:aspartyl-tRNA(Asn)/glutamyl-tRNA(Gln) amidotransferase subunit B